MIKMFLGSGYRVQHKDITEQNAHIKLSDDIRTKLLGNVNKFLYQNNTSYLAKNKNVKYLGGFYYEDSAQDTQSITNAELSQIEEADLVVICLMYKSLIATVSEMLYASSLNKRIVIFADPKIVGFDVTNEYWFPIITANKMNSKSSITIVYVNTEDEIVNWLNNLKEVYLEGTDLIGKTTIVNYLSSKGIVVFDRYMPFSKCIDLNHSMGEVLDNIGKLNLNDKEIIILYTTNHEELNNREREVKNEYDKKAVEYSKIYTNVALQFCHKNVKPIDITKKGKEEVKSIFDKIM